jgi:hypothetical protein
LQHQAALSLPRGNKNVTSKVILYSSSVPTG